jgi:hypothetical protein
VVLVDTRHEFGRHRIAFFSEEEAVSFVRLAISKGATQKIVTLRDRFYKTPFRPKTFWIKFHPSILDKVPSKHSRQMCIRYFWTEFLGFMAPKGYEH